MGERKPVESVYLKTLVEVVRTGSLSRAADTLAVTQPAVSRRIKFLEEHYGAPLLDRSGPQLRPTDAGRLVYHKALALLEIEDDLLAGLHRLEGKTRISFSSTPTFGTAHLPDILREFMLTGMDTADLKFTFQSPEQILAGLDGGLFDVAVMEICDRFDLSGYVTADLPGDEVVYVTAPSIDLAGPEARVDDVLRLPLFVRSEQCCSRLFLEDNLHAIGHALEEFQKLIVVDDLHLVVKALVDGDGASFISRDLVREHLDSGRLRTHVVQGFQRHRRRAVVLSRPARLSGPLAQFVVAVFGHFDRPVPDALRRTDEALQPSGRAPCPPVL
jgi:DNA-binding transcriptional LysR family regulator